MIPVSEAIEIIERKTFSIGAEIIELENSIMRVLEKNGKAGMELPPNHFIPLRLNAFDG